MFCKRRLMAIADEEQDFDGNGIPDFLDDDDDNDGIPDHLDMKVRQLDICTKSIIRQLSGKQITMPTKLV